MNDYPAARMLPWLPTGMRSWYGPSADSCSQSYEHGHIPRPRGIRGVGGVGREGKSYKHGVGGTLQSYDLGRGIRGWLWERGVDG